MRLWVVQMDLETMGERLQIIRTSKLTRTAIAGLLLLFLYPVPASAVYHCLITGESNISVYCCEYTSSATNARGTASRECRSGKSPVAAITTCSTAVAPIDALGSDTSCDCCEITYTDRALAYLAPQLPGSDKNQSPLGSAGCRESSVDVFHSPPGLAVSLALDLFPPGPSPYLLFSRFVC